MPLAPVLILVYTRKQHFYNCVESLAKCRLADQTHLIIASDAGKTDADQTTVQEIRDYCYSLTEFGKVEVIAYKKNQGTISAYNQAIDRILSEYDRFIYVEDDNILSPNFLEYMNNGLAFYENAPKVFAICGYSPPIKIKRNYPFDIFPHVNCCAWGTGYWKEKYAKVDYFLTNYQHQTNNKTKKKNLIKALSFPVFCGIERVVKTGVCLGDVAISYHCYINNMYNIYPCLSMVRNMGFDGSGLNMGQSVRYSNQQIQEGNHQTLFVQDIKNNKFIDRQFYKFQTAPYQSRVATTISLLKNFIYAKILLNPLLSKMAVGVLKFLRFNNYLITIYKDTKT